MHAAVLDNPPRQISWDEVIKLAEARAFGELIVESEEMHKRGPLLKVERNAKEHRIKFFTPWMACRYIGSEIWENYNGTGIFVSDEIKPTLDHEGTVTFFVPQLCKVVLPIVATLDWTKVRGLAPASERLLALFPELAFDREIAIRLLKGFPHLKRSVEKLNPDAELEDILKLFKHDSTREEYLWEYLEAATGEKDLHKRIY